MASVDARLLEILACPKDRGPLLLVEPDRLYNPRLHLIYRIEDGIPVLLADEAEAATDAQHAQFTAPARSDA